MMLFLLRWKGGWAGAYGKLGEVEKQASRSLKKKKNPCERWPGIMEKGAL
jgi:hypothetical protein